MARIDANGMRIEAKLIYAGPPGAGKRTNLAKLEAEIPGAQWLKPGSLDLEEPDPRFLVISLGQLKGYTPAFLVRAMPDDAALREKWFLEADGLTPDAIVFVADSDPAKAAANQAALAEVNALLAKGGVNPGEIAWAFQWNKRDVAGAAPVASLAPLNPAGHPAFEVVAANGVMVKDTFLSVAKKVLTAVRK